MSRSCRAHVCVALGTAFGLLQDIYVPRHTLQGTGEAPQNTVLLEGAEPLRKPRAGAGDSFRDYLLYLPSQAVGLTLKTSISQSTMFA